MSATTKTGFLVFFLLLSSFFSYSQCELNQITNKTQFEIEIPTLIVEGIPTSVVTPQYSQGDGLKIIFEGNVKNIQRNSNRNFSFVFNSSGNYTFVLGENKIVKYIRVLPLWYSIVPPLIAIIIAMLFKEVLTALLIGLLFGAVAVTYFSGDSNLLIAFIQGFFDIIDTRIIQTIADEGHASVIVFSLMIGSVVQIITKNGGMNGLVMKLARKVQTRRRGMLLTWLLGVAIFFDDYANTLVVGNTVRPITDRLKISRAKLAYIVDSTAAPVACLAFVTTWIGVELSYIQEGINIISSEISPYQLFLMSLPYRFYPFLALIFILFLIYQNRDFGQMLKVEKQSFRGSKIMVEDYQPDSISTDPLKESHWINAFVPVLIIVFGTFAGLIITG